MNGRNNNRFPTTITLLQVFTIAAMIASKRTASAFVSRLAATTTTTTQRQAGPTVARVVAGSNFASSSYCTTTATGGSFRPTQQERQHLLHREQRRPFLNQITSMFSSAAAADADAEVTPDSLAESFGGDNAVVGNNVGDAMYALYTADAVCFDVDSTVINEEGIDVLAEYLGKGAAVAELTAAAMEGGMRFDEALEARLNLLEPSRKQILDCLEDLPLELTPGIADLVRTLHEKKVEVFLVSGGFRIMIEPVADLLNIPSDTHLYANTIRFDETGGYESFCRDEPSSQDMGKPRALEEIRSRYPHLKNLVMVGDGATDAQAKPPAKAFIGFGGVVTREPVRDRADWFVTSFGDLTRIVELRD